MATLNFGSAKAHAENIKSAYESYSSRGWKCLPIESKSKIIRRRDWQNTHYGPEEFTGLCNIGVQLGAVSGNLIDIDLDHPLARKIAPWFLPPTTWRFGRLYGGEGDKVIASHYLYHVEGSTKSLADWRFSKKEGGGSIVKCMEYRGESSQTVFPPSVHEHHVEWIECEGDPPLIDEFSLKQSLGVIMTIMWVKVNIASGVRHETILRVIGGFAKAGVPQEITLKAVKAINYLIDYHEDSEGDVEGTYQRLAEGKVIAGFASLQDFGWETDRVKKWLPSKMSETGKVARDGKPKINMSRVSMEDAVAEAIKILDAVPNTNKMLFSYGSRVVAVVRRNSNRYNDVQVVSPTTDAVAHHIEGYIQFVKSDQKEQVDVLTEADGRLVRRMMDPSINWGLQQLEGVVSYPVLNQKGELVTDEGFHPDSGLFISDNMNITMQSVRSMSVEQAKAIIADVYDDFPFHNKAIGESLSATALVSAIARKVVRLSPMFIATSPYPQDGKTEWCFIPQLVLSKTSTNYAFGKTDEEQQKQLVTYFSSDPPIIMFDNQNGKLHSQSLTELLTSGSFIGRLLGTNDQVQFKPKTLLMANGINVAPSAEIATRSIIVEFDRRKNMNFKYPHLRDHVLAQRASLVRAALRILLAGVEYQGVVKFDGGPSRFTEWDEFVRKAIIVAGYVDPMKSDLRSRVLDDESEAREAALEWLFKQFPPGVKFKSADVSGRIGFDHNLENILKALAHRQTFSSVVVGVALGTLRGAEYCDFRFSWKSMSKGQMIGEWKPLTDNDS
jgi:hypothetical protein